MIQNYHAVLTSIHKLKQDRVIILSKITRLLKIVDQVHNNMCPKVPKHIDLDLIEKTCNFKFSILDGKIFDIEINKPPAQSAIYDRSINLIEATTPGYAKKIEQYRRPLDENNSILENAISYLLNGLAYNKKNISTTVSDIKRLFDDKHIFSITESMVLSELLINNPSAVVNDETYMLLEQYGIYRTADTGFSLVSDRDIVRFESYLSTVPDAINHPFNRKYYMVINPTNTKEVITKILADMYFICAVYLETASAVNKLIALFPRGSIFHVVSRRAQARSYSRVYRLKHDCK